MIEGLKAYPTYQDSRWTAFGAIPSHWRVKRLRNVAELLVSNVDKHTKPGELPVRLCNYVDVYKNERILERLAFMRATATREETERFRLRIGDVLITKDSEDWKDIAVPALVAFEAPDLVCGYHLAILRARRELMVGPYLHRAIESPSVAVQFQIRANGVTRYGLSQGAIKGVVVPVPPLDEQLTIARFLDHATRRIDAYIRAKRKLIALLNEQKQAIIHRAVTRGLDPNVKMKDSGVPWLGEVPEHWGLMRLKALADIRTGGRDTVDRKDDGAYPFFVRSQRVERIDTYSFDGEAVLTAGDGAGVAKVFHYVNGKFDYHQRVYKVSDFKEVKGRFFFRYFSATLRFEAFRETAKSTVDSLRLPMLQNFPVVVPPLAEQGAIVDGIEAETATVDVAISRTEREIELLREYRTRLIADVVTGQLDVREAAKSLPDDLPEETDLDDDSDTLDEEDSDDE